MKCRTFAYGGVIVVTWIHELAQVTKSDVDYSLAIAQDIPCVALAPSPHTSPYFLQLSCTCQYVHQQCDFPENYSTATFP
jgi:hypothetical protein